MRWMRLYILLILVASSFSLLGGARDDFHKGDRSEEHIEQIFTRDYSSSIIDSAYKALCETMMAEFVLLPTTKMSYFFSGKEKIESIIARHPDNWELRYVRLLVQLNAPWFLGYNANIDDDFRVFSSNVGKAHLTIEMKQAFVRYLLAAEYISEAQATQLAKLDME